MEKVWSHFVAAFSLLSDVKYSTQSIVFYYIEHEKNGIAKNSFTLAEWYNNDTKLIATTLGEWVDVSRKKSMTFFAMKDPQMW